MYPRIALAFVASSFAVSVTSMPLAADTAAPANSNQTAGSSGCSVVRRFHTSYAARVALSAAVWSGAACACSAVTCSEICVLAAAETASGVFSPVGSSVDPGDAPAWTRLALFCSVAISVCNAEVCATYAPARPFRSSTPVLLSVLAFT